VRPTRVGDAVHIAPIDVEREASTVAELVPRIERALERLREPGARAYSCVALVEGEIVGYGKCAHRGWPVTTDGLSIPDGWYLTGVEVARDHRRKGVARALTRHRLQWLQPRTDVVYYFTGERNYPSQNLHRALGFIEVARGVAIPLPPPFSNDELHVLGAHPNLDAFVDDGRPTR
jgi:aminoglycoside 6'-N-acetyltransferase I